MDHDQEKGKTGSENEASMKGPGPDQPSRSEVLDGAYSKQGLKKGLSKTKKVVLALAALLLLVVAATGTYAWAFLNQVQETQRVLLSDVTFADEYDISAAFPDHIVNIGLLGFDRGWNREELGQNLFRPDMLAVLSINFEEDTIAVVRVPRDSYVPIHGMNGFHDKINHSFYYGYTYGQGEDKDAEGIRYTLQTVSNVLGGIPIHYYVSVDMYSIIELVDAMGGVYYVVEEEIIDKHWEIGRVLVPAGPQIMDGKTYLRYLQYRDDKSNQDYGRIDRQMDLLKETFIYLREQGRITDIPKTYRIYKDYVETDLSYTQIAALAYYARDLELGDDKLKFYTINGDGQMKDEIWYQVIFQNQRVQIIKDVFGIDVRPWAPIVLVDSPEYLEEQERLRREEEMGFSGDELEAWEERRRERRQQLEDEQKETGEDQSEGLPAMEDPTQLAVVPDIRGKTLDEARVLLEANGFTVGAVTRRYYTFLEEGLVIHSEPLGGAMAGQGESVNLILSQGPQPAAER